MKDVITIVEDGFLNKASSAAQNKDAKFSKSVLRLNLFETAWHLSLLLAFRKLNQTGEVYSYLETGQKKVGQKIIYLCENGASGKKEQNLMVRNLLVSGGVQTEIDPRLLNYYSNVTLEHTVHDT